MLSQIISALFTFLCGGKTTPQEQPQEQHPPVHYPPNQQKPAWQHKPSSPHRPQVHHDQNLINQSNEHYISLRARANAEGDAMAKCFQDSHQAYANHNGALAKELSNKGKEHQLRMEQLNLQASNWIFNENNKDSKQGEIDLHGLYVKEAITRTDHALQEAKDRGDSQLSLIVGKGLHSTGGAAKIKPAIEELMQKHQLKAELDPHNFGVLIVEIGAGRNRGVGPDEITRRLEGDDKCIIM